MLAFHLCDSFKEAADLLWKWDYGRTRSAIVELQRKLFSGGSSLVSGDMANACKLVRSMTLEDPEERSSANETLSHPFLSGVLKEVTRQPTTQSTFPHKSLHVSDHETEKENVGKNSTLSNISWVNKPIVKSYGVSKWKELKVDSSSKSFEGVSTEEPSLEGQTQQGHHRKGQGVWDSLPMDEE